MFPKRKLKDFLLSLFIIAILWWEIGSKFREPAIFSPGLDLQQASNSWEEEQETRKAQIRRACESFEEVVESGHRKPTLLGTDEALLQIANDRSKMGFLYVNEEHKFIYCVTAKVGSTIWKKVLMVLNHSNLNVDEISGYAAHGRSGLTMLKKFSTEEIFHRLKIYPKFMTVRNPFERLLSAYQSKFSEQARPEIRNFYNRHYGHEWMTQLRNQSNKDDTLRFEEMLEILSQMSNTSAGFNRHWKPVSNVCYPCLIQYDYIANFTSLERDANEILGRVLKGSNMKFPYVKNSTTKKLLETLLPTFDPKIVREIKNIYRKDYEMFGFPMDQYVVTEMMKLLQTFVLRLSERLGISIAKTMKCLDSPLISTKCLRW